MITPETLLGIAKRETRDPEEVEVKHVIDEAGIPRFSVVEYVITRSLGDDYPIVMGYQAFEVVSWDAEKKTVEWQDGSANAHPVGTPDLAKAEQYLSCSVKSDGCSHWTFGGYHFCGGRVEDFKRFKELLDAIMEMAEGALPESFVHREGRRV